MHASAKLRFYGTISFSGWGGGEIKKYNASIYTTVLTCWKNSSLIWYVHFLLSSRGLAGLLRSAQCIMYFMTYNKCTSSRSTMATSGSLVLLLIEQNNVALAQVLE